MKFIDQQLTSVISVYAVVKQVQKENKLIFHTQIFTTLSGYFLYTIYQSTT